LGRRLSGIDVRGFDEGRKMIEGKPHIVQAIESEGICLKQRGRESWASCPFHIDLHPSFKINLDQQTFHCFSCGAHGDVIDFIQKLYNLSFKDALKYLGMNPGKPPMVDPKQQRKRELVKDFEQWRRETYRDVCDEYNIIWHALRRCENMDEIGELSEVICEMGLVEDVINILSGKDEEAKYEYYCASF